MILVRLGETVLHHLAITSLNNSLKKKGDWFYDAYTPNGICPDGFAPQADKNLLGRQNKPHNVLWATELIKPASEMVKYLETEDYSKNEYNLADMLTKTCLVCGDADVYERFDRMFKHAKAEKPKIPIQFFEDIKMQTTGHKITKLGSSEALDLDIQRFIDRSISLYVKALGLHFMCNNAAASSFEILDALYEEGALQHVDQEKLHFMCAIACEIRLRASLNKNGQNIFHCSNYFTKEGHLEELSKTIRARAVVDCFNIGWCLGKWLKEQHMLKSKQFTCECNITSKLNVARQLKLPEVSLKLVEKGKSMPEFKQLENRVLLHFYTLSALQDAKKFHEVVAAYKTAKPDLQSSCQFELVCKCIFQYADSLIGLLKYKKAIIALRIINWYHHRGLIDSKLLAFTKIGYCFYKMGRYHKAIKCFSHVRENYNGIHFLHDYFDNWIFYGCSLLKLQTYSEALNMFNELESGLLRLHNVNTYVLNKVSFYKAQCLAHLKKDQGLEMLEKA